MRLDVVRSAGLAAWIAQTPPGTVVVCDTYNGALRSYDPATGTVTFRFRLE